MAASGSPIEVHSFLTATLGILVLFVGKILNRRIRWLREFTIPEPVSGGLLVALVLTLLHAWFGLEMNFGMRARDVLLVVFFTTVGINASFADLRRGGRSLLVLLAGLVPLPVEARTEVGWGSRYSAHLVGRRMANALGPSSDMLVAVSQYPSGGFS